MPTTCVTVSKVLVLQILLGLCTAAYEYGYHPSAEEFDSLMRETRKTWTRDLLANERRRAWTNRKQTADRRNGAGFYNYVPKYHYEKQTDRFSWPPGYVQKVHDRNDQQQSASNIGVGLDFSMYDDIVMKDPPTATVQQQQPVRVFVQNKPTFLETEDYEDYDSFQVKPYVTTTNSPVKLKKQTASMATLLETSTAPSLINLNKFAIPNLNKNRTQLPIFFTNPTTGIVYAITEVGKVQENSTQANDSIPIYVTKEQYDRDLFLQRKYYENSCHRKQSFNTSLASAISAPSNTTVRPKILHLQNSSNSPHIFKKPTVIKLPTPPPPVTVQTTVNIRNDRGKLPPKRKKKLKTARRKKKKPIKRPGRKPVAPILKELTFPKIILGTRTTVKPRESHEHLATQLEKPADGMVFSKRPTISTTYPPLSASSGKLGNKESSYVSHKIRRRSVTNARENKKQLLFTQNNTTFTWSPTVNAVYAVKNNTYSRLSQLNTTKASQNNLSAKVLIKNSLNQPKLTPAYAPVTELRNIATPFPKVAFTAPNPTTTKDMQTIQNFSLATARSAAKTPKTKKAKKQKQTKRKSSDSNYDYYFGLLDSGDEDLDDDDEDDEYDADEDDYYYSIKYTTPESPHATIEANEHNEHFADDSSNDFKEETSQLNSSSAEEGADYGAMDVENTIPDSQEIANAQHEIQVISNTKDTASKKRIRRRPPSSASSSNSVEEYDDDDYADDTDSGGISSFFRMIFYPVQMVMSRLIDGIGGEKDSSAEETQQQQAFPTYTLYHNAINSNNNKHKDNDIEAESEQGNSLSDWFSSWFGFNRRTKKIGSTTLAPPTVVTEEPSWFGSWFNYGDSRTTTEAASYEDYDDDYKWFLGWFDSKPKTKKRRSTTTTTTTSAPTPQIPILTIVDPMRNPQNWIGILAHHIINATSTSTHNPLFDAFTRATLTTTTENPDIPRKVTYDKYQIWRLKPQDDGQVKAIEDYKNSNDGSKLQWLKGPSLRGLSDVLVPPKMIIDFQGTLNFESIAHEVLIFDVGKVIEYEKSKEHYIYATTAHRPNKHSNNNNNHNKKIPQMTMSWNKYYEYDDILKYLESMRLRYPQMIELIHIGRSYEGRPLIIVKIESKQTSTSSAANASANRKKLKFKKKSGQANAVFIEAGTHGMEWIAPATSAWMISELVRIMKSNNSDSEQEFIKNTTWYILPVLNPDGYVFSHEFDRFWKKSRSRHVSRPGGIITSAMTWLQQKKSPEKVCYGVDLDRNWQYQWGRRGSSKSPCNEIFAGPVPFSEPETKALSAFLIDNRKQIKLYVSLQAYGQILSYPKKANESFNSDRMDDFLDVAMVGTDWLRKKGSKSRYKIDSTNDLIENRSGSSDAFAAYEVGVPFSYTLQLADNGVHGYLLPSSSIEPTARDAFEIITAMIDYI